MRRVEWDGLKWKIGIKIHCRVYFTTMNDDVFYYFYYGVLSK